MQPAAQILRPRQTETGGMGIDAGEVLGGNITDQDIRHGTMISADIAIRPWKQQSLQPVLRQAGERCVQRRTR